MISSTPRGVGFSRIRFIKFPGPILTLSCDAQKEIRSIKTTLHTLALALFVIMTLILPSTTPTPTSSTLFYDPLVPSILSPPGLRPFDDQDLLAVTRCAREARSKVNFARENILRTEPGDTDEILLSRLPLYQNRIEHPYKQGAIYCRSGGWIEILDERDNEGSSNKNATAQHEWVRGTKRETSRFAILEFLSIAFGLISIRGLESQNFLCMDWKGSLYAANAEHYNADCVFMEEMLENYYNLYSSCNHGSPRHPWYLSIRKSGKPRRGSHARKRQRSSHFIVVHFDETGLLDPVPNHLNRAAYRIQTTWMNHYGNNWRRSSTRHRAWAPATLLNSDSKSLSDILANSMRNKMIVNTKKTKNNNTKLAKEKVERKRAQKLKETKETTPMNEVERRVFRQERKRRRRLHREERLRELRRQKLQILRDEAASFSNRRN
ncbi:unnamed protein product [Bursaphelenchus xylophilus]|uniref:(pine wood nematode) hypothetical protein n=1 Tax=Bursaphelenchus xylophilus TaxID=6326 RepID=A0A1I7SQ19_BURXY|nr:unnamed protein product [Bursaphelenchus xylophilus]CAG9109499.1 unnamed protein product [Bursaphelenchus xylophilus]